MKQIIRKIENRISGKKSMNHNFQLHVSTIKKKSRPLLSQYYVIIVNDGEKNNLMRLLRA